jgi:PHD/YefM family antitoxin component YafN of YafNO toxin-antitoxin module
MITIPAQEVKRRGIGAVDKDLAREPVHIVKNNRPTYVVLFEEDYQTMMEDLALARIEASEADLRAGRVRKGSAADLMNELDEPEPAE